MLFEPKFVRCVWSDALSGKKVLFEDSISSLKSLVEQDATPHAITVDSIADYDYPFTVAGPPNYRYRFIYYDPNYEAKLAYSSGETIQVCSESVWTDCPNPTWEPEYEYRVKPEEAQRLRLGDKVRVKDSELYGIITTIDDRANRYAVGACWYDSDELEVLDE